LKRKRTSGTEWIRSPKRSHTSPTIQQLPRALPNDGLFVNTMGPQHSPRRSGTEQSPTRSERDLERSPRDNTRDRRSASHSATRRSSRWRSRSPDENTPISASSREFKAYRSRRDIERDKSFERGARTKDVEEYKKSHSSHTPGQAYRPQLDGTSTLRGRFNLFTILHV
jgi:hypothetical protein